MSEAWYVCLPAAEVSVVVDTHCEVHFVLRGLTTQIDGVTFYVVTGLDPIEWEITGSSLSGIVHTGCYERGRYSFGKHKPSQLVGVDANEYEIGFFDNIRYKFGYAEHIRVEV